MKERVLEVSLSQAIEMFSGIKWKFYEINPSDEIVKVEVPHGGETLVVEMSYKDEKDEVAKRKLDEIVSKLREAEFLKQKIRMVSDW